MRTIEYLTDPNLAPIYAPSLVAGLAIALVCGVLSVPVVLKRLAFVGQGVSHAAFGGVGLAFILGISGIAAPDATPAQALAQELGLFGIVLGFCVLAALGIARLTRSGQTRPDTAIGIVLVGAMAIGFLLIQVDSQLAEAARQRGADAGVRPPSVEAVLFGSFLAVGWADAVLAWGVALGALGVTALTRRPMLFWAFDEPAALAFGVPVERVRTILLVLLSLTIVTTMRLAGVVLATALLVLPGAIALRLSLRLVPVVAWSIAMAIVGVLVGLIASFELDLQPGPCIVGVLVALFTAAIGLSRTGVVGGEPNAAR